MIAASLIDENRMSYQLNGLAKHYVGIGKDEKVLVEAAKEYGLDPKADMWRLPPMFVGQYAERDAESNPYSFAASTRTFSSLPIPT